LYEIVSCTLLVVNWLSVEYRPMNAIEDFYCKQVLSGKTAVKKVLETENVLAYHHTRPFWEVHIVVIPKAHIGSLLTINDNDLLLELLDAVKQVAAKVVEEKGAARVLTNLGDYQDSKHLHFHVNSGDPLRTTGGSPA
jgi:histidine triad (HIT) family protein